MSALRTVRKRLQLALTILCAFYSATCTANKHIIAAAELNGLFNPESYHRQGDHGVYYDIVALLLKRSGLAEAYEILIMPMKRAKQGFLRKQYACYVPGLDTFDTTEEQHSLTNTVTSTPINVALVRALTPYAQPLITRVADIGKEHQISMVRGTPVSAAMLAMIDAAESSFLVNSEIENIRMLMNKRANVVLTFYPDVLFAYKTLQLEHEFPYARDFLPLVIRDAITCHKRYREDLSRIQAQLTKLQQSGQLREMLGDYFVPEPTF